MARGCQGCGPGTACRAPTKPSANGARVASISAGRSRLRPYETEREWRVGAKDVRRARHAVPLRNRARMARGWQALAPGVAGCAPTKPSANGARVASICAGRSRLRPYETGDEWRRGWRACCAPTEPEIDGAGSPRNFAGHGMPCPYEIKANGPRGRRGTALVTSGRQWGLGNGIRALTTGTIHTA